MNEAADISMIESYLAEKLKVVSENIYAGHLPSTLPTDQKEFVVIDCSTEIYDYDAYNGGTVAIYLYTMPTSKVKNVPLLHTMEKAYREKFLTDCDSDDYSITQIGKKTGYDSDYGMDFIYMAINLIVK